MACEAYQQVSSIPERSRDQLNLDGLLCNATPKITKDFHGVAPNRDAVYVFAEVYSAVRCGFAFSKSFIHRCGAVR